MIKLIFFNYEALISTNDNFIEGEPVNIKYYDGSTANQRPASLSRIVKYDNEAEDLYIEVKGKKYFYSEFK